MNKILEVKNVSKIYKSYKSNIHRLKELFSKKTYHKKFISNEHISFDLFQGETLGLIGVNGAGKSTILKIIAGVIDASSGEIIKHGKITALLELGTGFNEEYSGYDNIYLNGTLLGMSEKEIDLIVDDVISFSELEVYINEAIKTYSSGMKMRLAFSIAMFSDPKILIVDEALSVGDAHFSAKCTKALKERKAKNLSIIYVSHDLNSLKILCDRIILLDKGKIIEEGDPVKVMDAYNYLISKLNDKDDKITYDQNNDKSFGTFDLKIEEVKIVGEISKTNLIQSRENAKVKILIKSNINSNDMTIGILIRDKFGQDIFGTNTFLHNMKTEFIKDNVYLCTFEMNMTLGVGKYSIGCTVHTEVNHLDNCAHWINDACVFEIIANKRNQFIGICNLDPKIECVKLK